MPGDGGGGRPNLLADGPPDRLWGVAGCEGVAIYPDYRNMLRLEALLRDGCLPEGVKARLALGLLYPEPPADTALALRGLVWFYYCGRPPCGDAADGAMAGLQPREAPVIDLLEDADLILAGFWAVYGIRLTSEPFLHWWEFCALLAALPEDCLLARVAGWRGAKLAEVPRQQRAFVARMKRQYALQQGRDGGPRRTGAAGGEGMAAWLDRRYAEAAAGLERAREEGDGGPKVGRLGGQD